MRKNLLKSLSGFTLGVTLLITAYVVVYFIAGENAFVTEMQQLQNIKILIAQVLFSGLSYYLLALLFNIYKDMVEKDVSENYIKNHPYKFIFTIISACIIIILILFLLLGNVNIYSQNIQYMNSCILVLLYVLTSIIFCIKVSIERNLINKFNQKLQEKNK